MDSPDWAFGLFTPEAIEAKRAYYTSLQTKEGEAEKAKLLAKEEARLRSARPTPHAKPERNLAIWKERKEQGTTLGGLGKKYGLTVERVRQIVAKEDRRLARLEYFDALRKQDGAEL